jgi:hypothetical protein
MRVIVFLLLAAAISLASSLPDVDSVVKSSPPCTTLKCILSFPDNVPLPSDEPHTSNSPSFVDVILHINDDSTPSSFSATSSSSPSPSFLHNGRTTAERITGVTIDHFIAPRSFAASVPEPSIVALEAEPSILSVTRLLPQHKFSMSNLRRYFSGAPTLSASEIQSYYF